MAQDDNNASSALVIYETDAGVQVSVDFTDGDGWLTQQQVAEVFETSRSNVTQHLANVFSEGELEESSNVRKSNIAPNKGTKPVNVYSLDAVISVGYRISSTKGTRFRKWATGHLSNIATQGFSVDVNDPDSLRRVAANVRALRNSEQELYARVRDILKESSSNYDDVATATRRSFFAAVQDKFHYAVTGKTAAQLVLERADASKPNMGLQTFQGNQPTLGEAQTGKNYLTEDELHLMNILGEQFMLFAESKAFRGQKTTMEELSTYLNTMLVMNGYQPFYEYGPGFDRGPANAKAEREYKKFQKKQGNALGRGRSAQ